MGEGPQARRLSKPGRLAGDIQRMLEDALTLKHPSIEALHGATASVKLASLRALLHLQDLSRWKTGTVKQDQRRKGRPSQIRYVALEVNNRLISLLRGDAYFHSDDREQLRQDRAFVRALLLYWRRPDPRSLHARA